jgi:hypothetical protein
MDLVAEIIGFWVGVDNLPFFATTGDLPSFATAKVETPERLAAANSSKTKYLFEFMINSLG